MSPPTETSPSLAQGCRYPCKILAGVLLAGYLGVGHPPERYEWNAQESAAGSGFCRPWEHLDRARRHVDAGRL